MKVIDFFFSGRPLLHLPVWSIYLVSMNIYHHNTDQQFSALNLLTIISLSLITAGAYYFNQLYDIDSDRINRKLGFLHSDILSSRGLRLAFIMTSLISLILAAYISTLILIIFAIAFITGIFYSAPPLRLKDRPLVGLFANAVTFGFLLPVTVRLDMDIQNVAQITWNCPLYFFLTVAAIHILTTIPDREGDQATGKKTIATRINNRSAISLAMLFILASTLVAYYSGYIALTYLSIFSFVVMGAALISNSIRLILLATKLPILLLTILAGYHYPAYFVFIVVLIIACRLYYSRRFGMVYPRLS